MSIHFRSKAMLFALCLATTLGCTPTPTNTVRYRPGRFEFDWPSHTNLTPGIRGTLDERLSRDANLLAVKLQDVAITKAVARANANSTPSLERVMQIEDAWRTATTESPIVVSRTDMACSRSLELLTHEDSDFVEILVTNARGHVICQSRMTERFYLGDENWWRECVETGQLSHSRIVYDQMNDTLALSIFAPVVDPSTGQSIGVARAVIRRRTGSR